MSFYCFSDHAQLEDHECYVSCYTRTLQGPELKYCRLGLGFGLCGLGLESCGPRTRVLWTLDSRPVDSDLDSSFVGLDSDSDLEPENSDLDSDLVDSST